MNYKKLFELLRNSAVAGILIGFGCITNLCCENSVVGAFLFSLGLMTVIIQDRWLFTGKIGYWGIKETFVKTEELLICLWMNLLSVSVLCWTFAWFSGLDLDASSIMEIKNNENYFEAFLRSVGCGAMMFIAVNGYNKTKNVLMVIMPVMVFILCGFDHCIANFGYMAMENQFFSWRLPVWIVGNTVGSMMISKI